MNQRISSPRVTVVVPCYNDGATLPETLESVFSQAETVELVVVNDGSTDEGTRLLLDQLAKDPRICLVRQDNQGLSAARMAGARVSSAPYIFPLDADDLLLPNAVTKLADALENSPACGIAYGNFVLLVGDERRHVTTIPHLDPWLLTHLNTVPVASLIRRKALSETEGWVLKDGYEDWDLWLSLVEKGWKGVKVEEDVFLYRVRPNRMFSGSFQKHDAIYQSIVGRHPALFAGRSRLRQDSRAPRSIQAALSVVAYLPVTPQRRHWLQTLIVSIGYRLPLFLPALFRAKSVWSRRRAAR